MKIDFSKPLLDMEDKPLSDNGRPVTLYSVSRTALFAAQKDGQMDIGKAEKCWELYSKLNLLVPVDLKAEEIVLLKERIAAIYLAPGITGQAAHMLNQEAK